MALVKGQQQMPSPATPTAPDVSTSLNFGLTAVETGVAEHDASLRSLNTQVPDIVSGMETLASVVKCLGVKIQEWEDECTPNGTEEQANPTPSQSTTPDPNPSNPTHPVKAAPGAPPTFSAGGGAFLSSMAHMGTLRVHQVLVSSFLGRGHPEVAQQPL